MFNVPAVRIPVEKCALRVTSLADTSVNTQSVPKSVDNRVFHAR